MTQKYKPNAHIFGFKNDPNIQAQYLHHMGKSRKPILPEPIVLVIAASFLPFFILVKKRRYIYLCIMHQYNRVSYIARSITY